MRSVFTSILFSFLIAFTANAAVPNFKYEFDKDFSGDEEKLVDKAMKLLNERFFDEEVIKCAMGNHELVSIDTDYTSDMDYVDNFKHAKIVMVWQWRALLKDKNTPKIKFISYFEKDGAFARAPVGVTKIKRLGDAEWSIKGNFEVELNQFHLDSNTKRGKDPLFWAGAIAHEMMHNLGHSHSDGKDDDYQDYQMIAFEQCLNGDGRGRKNLGEVAKAKVGLKSGECGKK